MKTQLSALLDGEVDSNEVAPVLSACTGKDLRASWAEFSLIGAAMRGEQYLDFDVSARVMRALDAEPTVLAPQSSSPSRAAEWTRSALALAATLAGVGVVAWVSFGVPSVTPDGGLAAANGAPSVASVASVASVVTAAIESPVAPAQLPARLQDYLVAHQTHAPSGALAGGTRHVVAVSFGRERR